MKTKSNSATDRAEPAALKAARNKLRAAERKARLAKAKVKVEKRRQKEIKKSVKAAKATAREAKAELRQTERLVAQFDPRPRKNKKAVSEEFGENTKPAARGGRIGKRPPARKGTGTM